jgi:CheY-like chemotaxis protein
MDAIGRLAGGVAHDFNNLLTVIAGYSDLVLSSVEESDPVRPSVQEIRKAADRAGSLTHQLLAFSRKQVLQPTVTDMNAVVADMQKMLQRLIGDDVALETELTPQLPAVLVDEGQWQQVIVNLAVNARDAMPGGGVLRIKTRVIEDPSEAEPRAATALPPGRYVLLEVSDTGAGMEPQVLAQIFEPFFTTKHRDKGVGLGLAMVYGIVKQSGGWIWVESSPGTGATFRMYLPATQAHTRTEPREQHPEPTTSSGETIMLVEDQPEVRRLAARVLRGRGYDVLEASGGEEALALASAHRGRLHLLVTDVVMPGMKGPEVARRLTAARPGLPVLYVSGYADEALEERDDLLANGMLLLKPFSPDVLAGRVRELLDGAA